MGIGLRIAAPLRHGLRGFIRWTERVFAVIGLLFVMYTLLFDLSIVVSESMEPTLKGNSIATGDWVLAEKVTYLLRRPKRWEVVAFRNGEGMQVMKRVVGLPGESISLKKHRICIDGDLSDAPQPVCSLKYSAYGNLHRGKTAACGKGYYVMGDNSWDSHDSRFDGPLVRERIRGRAWVIVWPPSRIGWIN